MSWLFKQVWVWILIAFLLGLILTWIYVVHKASRTVEAPDDRQQSLDEAPAGEDESHHGAAIAGGAAAAGAGAVATTAAVHHDESDETDESAEPEQTHPAPGPGDQEPAEDQPEPAAETAEPGRGEQQAESTATPASRDDQPEAAGAAAAAAARARADEEAAADAEQTGDTTEESPLGAEQTKMGATDVSPSIIHDDDNETIGEMTAEPDETPTVGTAETTEPVAGQVGTVTAGHANESVESQPSDAAAEDAPAATDDAPSSEDPAVQRFGPGAASTLPDGSAPPGHPIKGNVDSMLFHTKDSPRYAATSPGVWFADEAAATAAGFAHWDRTRRGTTPSHLAHAASDEAAPPQPAAEDAPVEAPAVEDEPVETQPPAAEDEPAETQVAADEPTSEEEPTTEETADDVPAHEDDPITAQFGSGAASPREDGSAPSPSYTIKGDADTMTFHTEDSPRFAETEAEIWFRDEASAKAAGFLHWDRGSR